MHWQSSYEQTHCAGVPAQFTKGEIQLQQDAEEDEQRRLAEFRARLPELPPLPTKKRLNHAPDAVLGTESAAAIAGATEDATAQLADATAPAEPEMRTIAAAGGAAGDEESCLWTDVGFYVTQCLPWLPRGTPEQHFAVLGLQQQLSRSEWDAFVAAELAKAAALRGQRRERGQHAAGGNRAVEVGEDGEVDDEQGRREKRAMEKRSRGKRHHKRRREEEGRGERGGRERSRLPQDVRRRRKGEEPGEGGWREQPRSPGEARHRRKERWAGESHELAEV
jgi:hypothetical protein